MNTVDVLINCMWRRKVEGRSIEKDGPHSSEFDVAGGEELIVQDDTG